MILHCMDGPHFVYPSSVKGHVGCFHLLATVNNAAVHMGVQVSVQVLPSVLEGLYPAEFLEHMVIRW